MQEGEIGNSYTISKIDLSNTQKTQKPVNHLIGSPI